MSNVETKLTAKGQYLVLTTALLGWFSAGVVMSTSALAMRSAAIDLLSRTGELHVQEFHELNTLLQEHRCNSTKELLLSSSEQAQLEDWRSLVQTWYGYYQCAMLFGAAAGGLVFGRFGDQLGRSLGMASSILCFSLFSASAYFAETPTQLLVIWFLGCLGIGGMWPNGVALLSETWSNMSRPFVAGIMGASANVGLFSMATLATYIDITPGHWRWAFLVCGAAAVLGILALVFVPESPRWLATRQKASANGNHDQFAVFRPPILKTTVLGILLATIPLVGGWGSANWMVPWAGEAGETANPPNHKLKAQVHQARALPGMVGTVLGGWIAHLIGRRLSFCVCSLGALFCAQWIFWMLRPTDPSFFFWVGCLGFFSGFFFGWLPLFLPELFSTSVRATGTGVSFNFGRIVTAVIIFLTAEITAEFGGDYAHIGRVTSLVFLLGAIVIWCAPKTDTKQLV